MQAYTVTTDQSAKLLYPLPSPGGKPSDSDQMASRTAVATWQRNLPAGWTADRYTQAAKYEGIPYVAIRAIAKWLGGCTVRVLVKEPDPVGAEQGKAERGLSALKQIGASKEAIGKAMSMFERRILKAMATPGAQGEDEQYTPAADDHPLVKLFERPNNRDTFQRFAQKWVINQKLTGNLHVWHPLNDVRTPAAPNGEPDPELGLWVLPSWRLSYIPMSANYPFGGWRLMSGSWNSAGVPYAGNVPIDARQVLTDREPGVISDWDGLSPLQAMARYVDILDGCDESRANGFRTGLNPDAIVSVKGATQNQLDQAATDFQNKQGGSRNARKMLFIDGEAVDIDLLSRAVKEMDYVASWEQIVKPLLAALGVPPMVAGLVDASNYAAFFAALRMFFSSELRPMAHEIGASLTHGLAIPYFGAEYCIQVDVPTIDDPEMQETQINTDVAADAILIDEIRALRNREPLPDGKGQMTPSEYKASVSQPQPGQGNGPLSGEEDIFGMGADSGSGNEEEDIPRPDNPAGEGSLPSRIKGFVKGQMWDESKHKRGQPENAGQFGSGSGGGGGVAASSGGHGNSPQGNATPPKDKGSAAIQWYTSRGGWEKLNDSLRRTGKPNAAGEEAFQGLQEAFDKTPVRDKPMKLYRVTSTDDVRGLSAMLRKHEADGEPYEMKGMISTTASEEGAAGFYGNVKLTINAVHALDASPHSDLPEENEFILNHGSKFTVDSVGWDQEGNLEATLTQLPPEDKDSDKLEDRMSEGEPTRPEKKKPSDSDPVHDYLPDFNDPENTPPTAQDARDVNNELKAAGSRFRVVPSDDGKKWEARHVADLHHNVSEQWVVATNPLTGRPELGDADYYREMRELSGDKNTRGYLQAFNDPDAKPATQAEADEVNAELEADGSKYRVRYDADYKLWVAEKVESANRVKAFEQNGVH